MASSSAAGPALSRRSFLAAASAAGVALVVSGCTSGADGQEPVTAAQVDSLADQVAVQQSLVAAYAAAAAANSNFGKEIAPLADQATTQLRRLEKASPTSTSSWGGASPPAPPRGGAPPGGG
jgi:hypothetical protein